MNDKTLKLVALAVGVFLLVIVLLVIIFLPKDKDDSVAQGISYLESLEAREPIEITQPPVPTVTDENGEPVEPTEPLDLPPEQLALLEQIRNEEVDIWSLFHDYVILGDSRAVGFWYFDFLPEDNCLTGGTQPEIHLPVLRSERREHRLLGHARGICRGNDAGHRRS